MRFTPQDEEFRAEVRAWLDANLAGEFAGLRGAGGPGREHERFDERLAWNRHLAAAGWTCLGWPAEFGGRGATLAQQVIFHEEYARAARPPGSPIVGEELLGPTLIAFGTPEQQQRFLPPIRAVTELWCQGYSEPGAGSDLASVATRAVLDGDRMGDHRPEDLDLAGPRGRLVLRAGPDRARLDAQPRPVLPAGPDGPAGGHGPPDPAAHRHLGVQRGLLRRRAHRRRPRGRRARRRLAGGQGHAGPRARRGHARPAGRLPARARGPVAVARRTAAAAIRCCATSWPGPGSAWRPSAPTRWTPWAATTRRGLGPEDPVVPLAPGPRRAGHGGARRRAAMVAGSAEPRPTGSGCSCSAGPRRSTAGRTRSSATSSPPAPSACPDRA